MSTTNHSASSGVRPVRAFTDNYIWLIEAPEQAGPVVAVDPGEAAPVEAELERSGRSLAAILLTHHHPDHIGGVARAPGERARVPVIGPGRQPHSRSYLETVGDGERCELPDLGLGFDILHVPGHTLSHIAFWGHGALFCGDTLFSAGCGRMFEGTPVQMNASLSRLRNLPPETAMYCGHEYTAANLRFALTVEPANRSGARVPGDGCARLRAADAAELCPRACRWSGSVNPFLRCDVPAVRDAAASARRPAARRGLPRSSGCCAPGRISSADGVEGWLACGRCDLSVRLGGRAARSAPARTRRLPTERIVLPPAAGAQTAPRRSDSRPRPEAPPSLAMPREWQHQQRRGLRRPVRSHARGIRAR